MIHFLAPAEGVWSMEEYLARDRPEVAARIRIVPYEDLWSQSQVSPGTYVLAGLDQLEGAAERNLVEFSRQLLGASGVRVLNDPTRTLRRFDLLNTLHRLQRSDFRVARPHEHFGALRYPVYLRQNRSHGGNISPLLHSAADVERALGRAVVQGYPWNDILVIEFCSTADASGLYRKYAAFKVGTNILARSLYVGREWMLKFDDSVYTRSTVLEEQHYVTNNPHHDQLAEIFAIAAVEFGQIDYSVKDGRVQTWEINLNPTVGRTPGPFGGVGPRELWPIRDETREYFFDRFREAWAEVDTPSGGHPPIAIRLERADTRLPRAATVRGRVVEAARAVVRPGKKLALPLASPFLRALAIWLRYVHRIRQRRSP